MWYIRQQALLNLQPILTILIQQKLKYMPIHMYVDIRFRHTFLHERMNNII